VLKALKQWDGYVFRASTTPSMPQGGMINSLEGLKSPKKNQSPKKSPKSTKKWTFLDEDNLEDDIDDDDGGHTVKQKADSRPMQKVILLAGPPGKE
jgi:hypothetical protein